MRVLLHSCCATCASYCIVALRQLGHDVTLFFSNANISPNEEFIKRLEDTKLLAKQANVPLFIDEPLHSDWIERVAKNFEKEKEKGARCERCFRYSLERTHAAMLANGFDCFTTTLSISPHKHTPTLFAVGRAIDPERFLAINFKKNDGYTCSLKLAAEMGIRRQIYCGCEFSIRF